MRKSGPHVERNSMPRYTFSACLIRGESPEIAAPPLVGEHHSQLLNLENSMLKIARALAVAGLSLVAASPAWAEGFGAIEGQFIIDGAAPELKPLVIKGDATAKDAAVCAKEGVRDDSLVVNPDNKGIANIFVYLRKAPKSIDPSLKASKTKDVVFDNKGCQYVPHAQIARTDQQLHFTSSDAVAHNIHTYTLSNPQQNFILQANDQVGSKVDIKTAETLPMAVKCDIHPWMNGWVLIADHPYAAVTDKDGKFKIEGLPEGEHSFRVWHELPGYVEREWKVKVEGGKTTTAPPVKVPAAKLAKK
jgi:hypothetical protein